MKNIKKPLGIIKPDNLHDDERFLLNINFEISERDKTCKLFSKNKHFVFWNEHYNIFDKCLAQTQEEFPLMALPWFIDTIEERYWNYKPDGKETPGDVSEHVVIDGETVGINPMRHCCAENLPGYSFWNKNRHGRSKSLQPKCR